MQEIYTRVEKLITQGVREKAIRSDLADLAPFFLMGMMRSLVMRDVIHENGDGLTVEADRLLSAFLGGVGVPS